VIRGLVHPHPCPGDQCPVCAQEAERIERDYWRHWRRWVRQLKCEARVYLPHEKGER
jgi:hypothetical protein